MTKLLLLLVPLLLYGQVSVDTVVRLPERPSDVIYVPGVNKLYINTSANRYMMVVDCETYAVTKLIPTGLNSAWAMFHTLDWRRDKLYCIYTTPLEMAVFDCRLDSLVRWLPIRGSRSPCYVSTNNEVYAVDTCINVIDCETDSVVRTIMPGSGQAWGRVAWDSVGRKVYVTGPDDDILAHSTDTDSLIATIRHPDIYGPIVIAVSPASRRAYVGWSGGGGPIAVLDCVADTFIRDFDIYYNGLHRDITWNPVEDKVYLPGLGVGSQDTTFGVDCATDSIVSRTVAWQTAAQCWTPWSNRLYVMSPGNYVRVLDCRTDSLLVDQLELSNWPIDIACSEANQRVYVVCAGDSTLYVLREDAGGIAGPEVRTLPPGPLPTILRNVLNLKSPISNPQSPMVLMDACGRRVMDLSPGPNDISHLSPGVYFIRAEGSRGQGSEGQSRKVVIQR